MEKNIYIEIEENNVIPLHYHKIQISKIVPKIITFEFVEVYNGKSNVGSFYKPNSHIISE